MKCVCTVVETSLNLHLRMFAVIVDSSTIIQSPPRAAYFL